MAKPLVVRLRNWVGDVVLLTPSLRLLEKHGFDLQLIGKGWARSLFSGHPWKVHTKPKTLRTSIAQLRALRHEMTGADPTFDRRLNAVVFPTSFSSALEMRLAGLKSIGYAQEARSFLLKKSEPIEYGIHAMVSYWNLTNRFLGTNLPPPATIDLNIEPDQQTRADLLLADRQVPSRFFCICPFAGGTFEKLDKTWPNFPECNAKLIELGIPVVICPGPGEEEVVKQSYPGTIVLEKLNLGEYLGILRRASIVISNDTGPAHMAAAIGSKVLSVLGPTKVEQWAPWGPTVRVVQSYPIWPEPEDVTRKAIKFADAIGNALE
ncbi:MAG: glycosyltransferase family 9 protein [Burkholderiaceae bacterium]